LSSWAIARRRVADWELSGGASFCVGDFASTNLATGSVDAIISIDALPFAADLGAALVEARWILRPGGRLVFTTREARTTSPKFSQLGLVWLDQEEALRAELPSSVADSLIGEANSPPTLDEKRPWFLITAVAA
jgi:ubiquinone/menaquinone biosynthesis C-methylase UbiE